MKLKKLKISKTHLFLERYNNVFILALKDTTLSNLNNLRLVFKNQGFVFIKTKKSELLSCIKNNRKFFNLNGYILAIATNNMSNLILLYSNLIKYTNVIQFLFFLKKKEIIKTNIYIKFIETSLQKKLSVYYSIFYFYNIFYLKLKIIIKLLLFKYKEKLLNIIFF